MRRRALLATLPSWAAAQAVDDDAIDEIGRAHV